MSLQRILLQCPLETIRLKQLVVCWLENGSRNSEFLKDYTVTKVNLSKATSFFNYAKYIKSKIRRRIRITRKGILRRKNLTELCTIYCERSQLSKNRNGLNIYSRLRLRIIAHHTLALYTIFSIFRT